jgi:hypothetical protein
MNTAEFFQAVAIVYIIASVLALLFRIVTGHWLGG